MATSIMVSVGMLIKKEISILLRKKGDMVLWCDNCSLFLYSVVDYFDVCSPQDSCSLLTVLCVAV